MAFRLHYQPQVDISTRQVRGFEALLRWNHAAFGEIPPMVFIPMAEKLGLIGRIGTWVLRQATAEAARWEGEMRVAVNVSALQFRDRTLPATVAAALRDSGLAPSRLELEITESVLIRDKRAVATALLGLRDMGVRVAMDDFGTGYSSFSYLSAMPFDKIKIDKSFVSGLGQGAVYTAIVRSMISLCTSLGVTCTAEGVETPEQVEVLAQENCSELQGYLLGRPGPAAGIPGLLRAQLAGSTVLPAQA